MRKCNICWQSRGRVTLCRKQIRGQKVEASVIGKDKGKKASRSEAKMHSGYSKAKGADAKKYPSRLKAGGYRTPRAPLIDARGLKHTAREVGLESGLK